MRLILLLALSGCAALPPCSKPDAMVLESPRGILVVFTAENLMKLQQRMEAIRDGKCDPDKEPDAI